MNIMASSINLLYGYGTLETDIEISEADEVSISYMGMEPVSIRCVKEKSKVSISYMGMEQDYRIG